ncbi:Eco29kI family restriction endonuclease [Pseudoalteromonas ostreae]|uniref:Eco29kI family restriction endonuclease n=1 Tax=Pseudoalteromonas ostreae TaxID=2774154 RepID=UPI001B366E01|nr:Eco29kI family restriction endonuclease [Pseudoalteromonas ostreae]
MMTINVLSQTFQSHQLMQLANEATRFLELTPKHPLPINSQFNGSGVYALYYNGKNPNYLALGGKPIYVGKAVPTGSRTGTYITREEPKLKNRLNEHVRSIQHTTNLNIADFKCQFIIIPLEMSAIISVVESMLINKYKPIWNTKIDGFGNHDPGKGRYEQARSEWDKIHPGRPWV